MTIAQAHKRFLIDREALRAKRVDAMLRQPRLLMKPDVFLFDLDGTLYNVDGRDPLNARTCDDDPANAPVLAVAQALHRDYGIVLATGRSERYRAKTHQSLIWRAGLTDYLKLAMRPEDDTRPDAEMKLALYKREIEPYFNVIAVFDDRRSVVAMWREAGLTCFQVADRVA